MLLEPYCRGVSARLFSVCVKRPSAEWPIVHFYNASINTVEGLAADGANLYLDNLCGNPYLSNSDYSICGYRANYAARRPINLVLKSCKKKSKHTLIRYTLTELVSKIQCETAVRDLVFG